VLAAGNLFTAANGLNPAHALDPSNASSSGNKSVASPREDGSFLSTSHKNAGQQGIIAILVLSVVLIYGFWNLAQKQILVTTTVSVLQPNVNIDMQKTEHRYTLSDLLNLQISLLTQCPPGLCIWTESALPTRLMNDLSLKQRLEQLATKQKLDLLIGSIDQDRQGNLYNAAFGIRSDGSFCGKAYHKRYLVPFGEYTPVLVKYLPDWVRVLTNTPAGAGYSSGIEPAALNLTCGLVSPLICFETISPELVAASVRAGGQLLVNISDLAWFHKSIIGEQMLAFSVFRSVENQRFFIFSANTGPSAIITPRGRIFAQTDEGIKTVLLGKVGFTPSLSPFTKWYLF
jgi:apolipoprotein N-acyltransferase